MREIISNMPLLLPPHEKVLARKFCDMVHEARLNHDEKVVIQAVKKYIDELSERNKQSLIDAIKEQMKTCNKSMLEKFNL